MSETNQIFQDIRSFAEKKGNQARGRRNMNRTRRGKCRKLITLFQDIHSLPTRKRKKKKKTGREVEHE